MRILHIDRRHEGVSLTAKLTSLLLLWVRAMLGWISLLRWVPGVLRLLWVSLWLAITALWLTIPAILLLRRITLWLAIAALWVPAVLLLRRVSLWLAIRVTALWVPLRVTLLPWRRRAARVWLVGPTSMLARSRAVRRGRMHSSGVRLRRV